MITSSKFDSNQVLGLDPILQNKRETLVRFDSMYNLSCLFGNQRICIDELIYPVLSAYNDKKINTDAVMLVSYDIAQLYQFAHEVNADDYTDHRIITSTPQNLYFELKNFWFLIELLMNQDPERPQSHSEDSKVNFLNKDEETGAFTTIRPNVLFFHEDNYIFRIYIIRVKKKWYVGPWPKNLWYPGIRLFMYSSL